MKHLTLLLCFVLFATMSYADVAGYNAECYNPANIGTVGQAGWTGCEGLLIVGDDGSALPIKTVKDGGARYDTGYEHTDGLFYTMADLFVGQVTNMYQMFYGQSTFNQDISGWDVSNVTTMKYMFTNAKVFNQNIGGWDVSKVQEMGGMFQYALAFNQDISGWDLSSINGAAGLSAMFFGNTSYNQDLSPWCVDTITSEPVSFSGGTTSWVLPKPNWGAECSAPATCDDGIMNQDETGVDVGGICGPAPTCSDGIMNQDETDVDCGGVCGACVSEVPVDGSGGSVMPIYKAPTSGHMQIVVEQF